MEAKANFGSPDPPAERAEFQMFVSSPGKTIKDPINFLRSDDLQANTPLTLQQHTHTHTEHTHDRFDVTARGRGEQSDASSEHAGTIRGEMWSHAAVNV